MATDHTNDVILAIGVELLMAGIATGVAGISDEVGTMMVVLMMGFFLIWLMTHASVLQIIPNVLDYARQKGAA